jgi:queuosine precursor transporter
VLDNQNKYLSRRETVYLCLSGLFLGTLAMLNILGISRFLDLSFSVSEIEIPFFIAVGVLPYPITFLCTDLISELYGKERANKVVWVGLGLNLWVVFILWLGSVLPPEPLYEPSGKLVYDQPGRVFFEIKELAFGAVMASMIAYLSAQFIDVHIYHFWKKITKGKHLWLRNNASTIVSQLVDTVSVILITHYVINALPIDPEKSVSNQLLVFIYSGYTFKFVSALIDTGPFYFLVKKLRLYLGLKENEEVGCYESDQETV